ncbi:hypothetical protein IEO21_01844 [Rhodonia placenta]|uniref:Uncharacterized protein n=1 Tax=Rhodonia placenta TaxID=104341 RepID=A0A8H7P941_9APHY|nr:hypothetical protein IEO21_01844 [Postia placenta]
MPRKPNATNATASTKLTSRQKTRAHVAFQSIDSKAGLEDEIEDDTDDVVINGDDENGMMEMLTMLQEFQKRKASKTFSRATVFHNKKNALFTDARKNVDAVVRDGMAYIDQCLAKISELKAQETSQENNFKDLSRLWENHEEIIQNLLGTYPTIIEDLSHRRAEQINEASAMCE